jgi:hypothetical protein
MFAAKKRKRLGAALASLGRNQMDIIVLQLA